jgi:hypothetical protein
VAESDMFEARRDRRFSSFIPFNADHNEESLLDGLWQYSQRNLTYENDILRAVQGILKSFESINIYSLWSVPEFELAERTSQGVPDVDRKSLLLGLTWLVCHMDSQVLVERIERREGFPTWSWVGWQGTVSWSTSSQR